MSAAGWKAIRRLGAATFVCEHCKKTSLLHLPEAGEDIYSRHWHVERRERRAPGRHAASAVITCSQDCARAAAAAMAKLYGHQLPKMRYSVHGPYTPAEP